MLRIKSNLLRGGNSRQEIALEELNPVSDAMLGGVGRGDGQRGGALVDGCHPAARQILRRTDGDNAAAGADVGDLKHALTLALSGHRPKVGRGLFAKSNRAMTRSSVSGRGMSTAGLTRKLSE